MSFTIEQYNQLKANVKGAKEEKFNLPKKKYRSKTEELYAAQLQARKLAGEIEDWFYEPITFKLAEKLKYTPDFLIVYSELGSMNRISAFPMEFIEIKGAHIRRNGIDKFKVARSLYPFFTFKMIQYNKGSWTEKYPE